MHTGIQGVGPDRVCLKHNARCLVKIPIFTTRKTKKK